jgi:O-antigen/teichoic acid export membrane protein
MDACGERELLAIHSRKGLRWMVAISLAIGLSYGLLGPWIVKLWVGSDIRPQSTVAYILAGAVIFWLGSARLPAVVAYSTLRLKSLLQVAGLEVLGKLALSLILFPRIGYLAPLAAINIIHAGGLFVLYRRLLK